MSEDQSLRKKSSLTFTWEKPEIVGGTAILDYTVTVIEPNNQEKVFNKVVNPYQVLDLTLGQNYEFKV